VGAVNESDMLLDRTKKHIGVAAASLAAIFSAFLAHSQTLDEQYSFYLLNSCVNMGFIESVPFQIDPGQAGPNLEAFCSRPRYVSSGTGTTGPGAPSLVGAAGRSDDQALRRRRETRRTSDSSTGDPDSTNDASVSLGGNLSAFLSVDYRKLNQDQTYYEVGREAATTSATLGIDYRFDKRGLIGLAAKFGKLDGDYDGGGNFQSRMRGATLYGSWSPVDELFIDLSAGFTKASLDSRRIVSFTESIAAGNPQDPPIVITPQLPTPVTGNTEGQETSADAVIGHDMSFGRFTMGPRIGGSWRRNTTDRYRESGATAMTLLFDEQTEKSVRASVGVQGTAAFTLAGAVIVPQLNANYIHEYENDQRLITAQFAEDLRPNPVRLRFLDQPPDRDTYTVRASAAAVFARGFGAFISFETTLGHEYIDQFNASAGIRLEL